MFHQRVNAKVWRMKVITAVVHNFYRSDINFLLLAPIGAIVYMFFLRNRLYLGRTDVTSFFMHFEKIGRGLLREGIQREGE